MYSGRTDMRQINKAQYDQDYAAAMARWEPAGQQTLESHVVVPSMIAFTIGTFFAGTAAGFVILTCEVLSHFSATPLEPLNMWSIMFVLMAFTTGFLGAFLWRIGVGDQMLMKTEEMTGLDLNGDGNVGFVPQTRFVPTTTNKGTRDVEVPTTPKKELPAALCANTAIKLLTECHPASRRGLNSETNGKRIISQGEASQMLNALEDAKHIKNNMLTQAGFDWLIVHLPQYHQCMLARPTE